MLHRCASAWKTKTNRKKLKLIKEIENRLVGFYNTITKADSSWENRPYNFYLLFGQLDEMKSPWIITNWKRDLEPYLEILIKQANSYKNTGIRVIKYMSEKRTDKRDKKEFVYHSEIKLGRLKWDEKSHKKWLLSEDSDEYFLNFEYWSPIWADCERRDTPPDIYITISNERDFENNRYVNFGYFMVIAIAKNLNIDSKQILKQLSEKVKSKATVLKTRRWGKPERVGNWTMVNGIHNTFSNGIYKEQSLHSYEFKELEFEPVWEIIYRNE